MRLQVVGCSHHVSSVAVRERLAFSPTQVQDALAHWRSAFPDTEAVLLSTCNRVEVYTAAEDSQHGPSHEAVVEFLAQFHHVPVYEVFDDLVERTGEDVVRHLFSVAASLDSMVVGEPQILAQVKEAYRLANDQHSTGPLTHGIFQAAVRVARRVTTETEIHKHRVSIPSVAVADYASGVFERFDDKNVLVIGAGEMSEETLRYLLDAGARDVQIINRSPERATELAARTEGVALPWDDLDRALIDADLVIATTGASEPIVARGHYEEQIEPARYGRPLFVLDLAIPRDFEPSIGDCADVYLYSIDDLKSACEQNRAAREKQMPGAIAIIEAETDAFMADLYHRATAPIIKRLRTTWQQPKDAELERLLNKLPDLDEASRSEITQAFDRLVNKLLHPPLESLRDESRHGTPHGLLDALKRLFQIKD
jgi:glutamyl-tRNA reductase